MKGEKIGILGQKIEVRYDKVPEVNVITSGRKIPSVIELSIRDLVSMKSQVGAPEVFLLVNCWVANIFSVLLRS